MEHDDFDEIHDERWLYFDNIIIEQNNRLVAFNNGITVKSHSKCA